MVQRDHIIAGLCNWLAHGPLTPVETVQVCHPLFISCAERANMPQVKIPMKDCIIPMYKDVLQDILKHGHTHYTFPGGRGSTKSSFIGGIAIPLLIMSYPNIHAVCFRKVGNTVQKSIFAQIVWGLYKLGVDSLFHIPKTFSTPITYLPTGQQIICMGLDDPNKVKSIKIPFGYIGITWFEELDQYAGENELRKVTQSTMRGGDKFWDFRTFNPPISKNNWANEYVEDCSYSFKENLSRNAGNLFTYKGMIIRPAQVCIKSYGDAVSLQEVSNKDNRWLFKELMRIYSPHPDLDLGFHTFNVYKDVIVVDAIGYRHAMLCHILRKLKHIFD